MENHLDENLSAKSSRPKNASITKPIYLDHHATTPLDPRILEEMLPYLTENFGNAASANHQYGWDAKEALEKARRQVATLLSSDTREVFFTSGATESNNLAIIGWLKQCAKTRHDSIPHWITSNVEHASVLEIARNSKSLGFEVSILSANNFGQVTVEQVQEARKKNTVLISLMHANNEVGSLNPITSISEFANEAGIAFHVDATQSVGKIAIDFKGQDLHLLSLSSHKIYGPKGVGALLVKRKNPRIKLAPLLLGAGQENGLRPGTVNLPGVVGLGKACEILTESMNDEVDRLKNLRDRLAEKVASEIPKVQFNGHDSERICNNLSLSLPGTVPDLLASNLFGLAYSSGSACATLSGKYSHVLKAVGLSEELAKSTLRLAIGRFNTTEEIDQAVEILKVAYAKSIK